MNPTNANDVLVNDGSPFTNTITRSKDGGVTWQKQSAGTMSFHTWGWAGSTLLVGTDPDGEPGAADRALQERQRRPIRPDRRTGTARGRASWALPSFLGGTASQLYVQSGTVQLSDPVIVVEETFTSRDGGATWQKVTFAAAQFI